LFSSFRLLLSAPDPPGDLHVGLVGRDREATVVKLGCDARAARWIEVAKLVLERWQEPIDPSREADGCEAASVSPYLAVVGDVVCWR